MTCAWIDTSSAEVGSSSTSMRGCSTSARANATRCRWPPLISCGRRSITQSSSPTERSVARTVSRRCCRLPPVRWISSGSVTCVPQDEPWVQRLAGILQYDLQLAAQSTALRCRIVGKVAPGEFDPPGGAAEQPGDHQGRGGFAAAAFADQRQRLASRDVERHAIHCAQRRRGAAERSPARDEMPCQPADT